MVARPALTLTRRALLTGAALGAVGCSARTGSTTSTKSRTLRYGHDHSAQVGRLRLPDGAARGLVVLVHGGFWSSAYGADLMEPLADDLDRHGFATWNIEYRRVGDGGGWPNTFTDVAAAFDLVPRLPGKVDDLPSGVPVHAVGHSAGGQLVAWAASRSASPPSDPGDQPVFRADHAFSLAGVLDLQGAARGGIGGAAVPELLGGFPDEVPERYREVDPALLRPRTGVTVVVAAQDQVVPATQAATYLARHRGAEVDRLDVPGDHFALIDPGSAAWRSVRAAIEDASR